MNRSELEEDVGKVFVWKGEKGGKGERNDRR